MTKIETKDSFQREGTGTIPYQSFKNNFIILHRGFDKIKQGGRVMVLDEKAAEKLYDRLRLEKSDESTYKIAFENEKGTLKDVLLPGNRWLAPNAYLKGQLQRFHKLISNDRIWPSEYSFEVTFEKSLFVFQISAFKVRN